MADERRLDIKVGMNASELDAEIKKTKAQLGVFKSEVTKTDAEMRAYGKSTDTLKNKKSALTKQIKGQEHQMALLEAAYKKSVEATGESSKKSMFLEKQMNQLAGQMARSKGELAKVDEELVKYAGNADKAGNKTKDIGQAMKDANADIDKHSAELNKAKSEIKLYGETQQTLGNKMKALQGIYDGQNDKLKALKAAYENEAKASGKSSDSAKSLKNEITNLEAAMNNTKSEIDATARKMEDLDSGADKAADGMDKLGKAADAAVKLMMIEKLAEFGQKLRDIGIEAIEMAHKISAQEAQFGQVFSNMTDGAGKVVDKTEEAHQRVEKMSKELGIVPKRLEPGYASIASQMMSLGIEADDAMQLAETASIGAADAAAFYDISLEQARERVQSFLKGNLSAAEGIGIFASVASLSSYALEKTGTAANAAGKEYKDMTEAEKQTLRTHFIADMQEKAAVTGQAAREMDQWENVIGNAKSSTEEFMAAVGDDAMEILSGMLQKLIPILQEMANKWKEMNPTLKRFLTIVGFIVVALGALLPPILAFATMAGMAGMTMGAFAMSILPIIGIIAGIIAVIALVILAIQNWDKVTKFLKETWEAFKEWIVNLWDGIKEKAKQWADDTAKSISESWESFKSKVSEIWNGIIDGIVETWENFKSKTKEKWTEINEAITETWNNIKDKAKEIWDGVVQVIVKVLSGAIDLILLPVRILLTALILIWEGIVIVAEFIWGKIGDAVTEVWEGVKEAVELVWNGIKTFLSESWNSIKELATAIWTPIKDFFVEIWEAMKTIVGEAASAIFNFVSEKWQAVVDKTTEIFTAVSAIISSIWGSIKSIFNSILTAIVSFVTQKWNEAKAATSAIWEATKAVISSVVNGIKSAIQTGIQAAVNVMTRIFEAGKSVVTSIWDGIKSVVSGAVSIMSGVLRGLSGPINAVIGFFQGMFDSIARIMDKIVGKITEAWNKAGDILSKLNPFKSEVNVDVDGDDPNPYDPSYGGGGIGGALAGISGVVGNIGSSLVRGVNSTINSMEDIYYKSPKPQKPRDNSTQYQTPTVAGTQEIRYVIETPVYLDSRQIAKSSASFTEQELKNRQTVRDILNGKRLYNA